MVFLARRMAVCNGNDYEKHADRNSNPKGIHERHDVETCQFQNRSQFPKISWRHSRTDEAGQYTLANSGKRRKLVNVLLLTASFGRMYRALFICVLTSGCVSATAGMQVTGAVNQHETPDLVGLGNVGMGLSMDEHSAVNVAIEVGSAPGRPILIGESISYTRMGPKRGWQIGFGFEKAVIGAPDLVRIFSHYLIPLRTSITHASPEQNEKGGIGFLFPKTHASYWTIGFGPTLYADVDEDNSAIGLGFGIQINWFSFVGY